jgi:cytochrome c oxidase subunit 2
MTTDVVVMPQDEYEEWYADTAGTNEMEGHEDETGGADHQIAPAAAGGVPV